MGNSSTKEERPGSRRPRQLERLSFSGTPGPNSPTTPDTSDRSIYSSRTGRGSVPDLSQLLGIAGSPSRDVSSLEHRRETKQEREARRLEKERVARAKERERSMREEHVDGGYLVTQGVYTGTEDYNKNVVRQLMIERRVAPFWRGLNEYSDSWTENQLVAAARGQPIPAPDEIPTEEQALPPPRPERQETENLSNLMVPISSRSQSYASDNSSSVPQSPAQQLPSSNSPSTSGPSMFRGRAKTLASLTTSSKNQQVELTPREMQLPRDPFVNGQPIEVFLYKDAAECPICFLYYPPYLNKTRCCDQSICSECFVQIKRPDPHPPEHADSSAPHQPPTESEYRGGEKELVSEPAACPFCVQPDFGITYEPPAFRRGLTYVNQTSTNPFSKGASAMSSSTSLSSALSSGQLSPNSITRRRTASVSATDPSVITTDRVRPDWHQKLIAARAHNARRSAAATALHTAAYLMGNRSQDSDSRVFPSFARRGLLGRPRGNESPQNSSPHLNMLALLAERHAASGGRGDEDQEATIAPPRGSSRRNRMDDLEEMMMMEAIRLSLASEEDRRKKEEKEAKKEAKKAEKENKKAEKAARKAGVYPRSANQNSSGFGSRSESSLVPDERASKGKTVQRPDTGDSGSRSPFSFTSVAPPMKQLPPAEYTGEDAQGHLERARAQLQPEINPSNSYRPSHLRNQSNVSSSDSSVSEFAPDSLRYDPRGSASSVDPSLNISGIHGSPRGEQEGLLPGTPPGGGAGMEPMLNFRSLAEMIGKDQEVGHAEQRERPAGNEADERKRDETTEAPTDLRSERGGSISAAESEEEVHEASDIPSAVNASITDMDSVGTGVGSGDGKSSASTEQTELPTINEALS
ncbi:MAG: hypothetical protein Q9214_002345 [Letrouitia sp. 1 TL-2023]